MKEKFKAIVAGLLILTVIVGCSTIEKTIVKNPNTSNIKLEQDFAYNLNQLMPRDRNYMFSPASIKIALALAANGAEGETQQQILDVVGANNLEELNLYSKQLMSKTSSDKNLEFSIANSVWFNTDRVVGVKDFTDEYKNRVSSDYNATAKKVNNQNAVDKINKWCSDNTNGKIDKIISDSEFIACIANAIYFKGSWVNEFNKNATVPDTFTDRNGKEKTIDFMNLTCSLNYYSDDNIQMVCLPYYGEKNIRMYVVLGDNNKPVQKLTTAMNNMVNKEVHVSMPKFKIEYDQTMNEALNALGITKAFDKENAEFGSMFEQNGNDSFYITKVLHKTYIDVNEQGTEAAAVTAVLMQNAVECVAEPIEFKADKPFTFIISDFDTNEILFMGEYAF